MTYIVMCPMCAYLHSHPWCFPLLRQILRELDEKEKASLHRLEGCTWHPEYGNWMVEATPRQPFSGYAADLVRVRVMKCMALLYRVPGQTQNANARYWKDSIASGVYFRTVFL